MNFEGIVLLSKAARELHETESLAEVQLVIDSCRFVSQSNYVNNSNKDYDWPILACFIREQYMADATLTRLENKVWFENSANSCGNYWILYHKTNKEASTVLCSVVKHLGSGIALKKWGKTLDYVSCFPLHFFRALPLPACFTTEQSTVEASLFVKHSRNVENTRLRLVFSTFPSCSQMPVMVYHSVIHGFFIC